MRRLNGVVDTLIDATSGEPRLGLIHGPAGRGKTKAVDAMCVRTGACFVSAARVWTPASMLKTIVRELGRSPAWSATDNLQLAAEALQDRLDSESLGRGLLVIDEADYLAKGTKIPNTPQLLDTVRDLHDLSGAPILLVGMDDLARTLSMFPQFWDRVLISEEFQPVKDAEIIELGQELAGLKIAPEVAESIRRATDGNLRQTILYMVRLDRKAQAEGQKVVALGWVAQAEKKINAARRNASQGRRLRRVK